MKRALMAALTGCLCVVVSSGAIALAQGGPKGKSTNSSSRPEWSAYYSVLRTARAATATTTGLLGVPQDWGIDPASVHEVPTAADAPARIWVAMSSAGPCILASPNRLPYLAHPREPGGGTCGGTSVTHPPTLAFGGAREAAGAFAAGETVGIGFAPDGVKQVTLLREDKSTEILPVRDNMYYFDSPSPTLSVSFSAASTGAVIQEVRGVN
jgi:hypothetical protein